MNQLAKRAHSLLYIRFDPPNSTSLLISNGRCSSPEARRGGLEGAHPPRPGAERRAGCNQDSAFSRGALEFECSWRGSLSHLISLTLAAEWVWDSWESSPALSFRMSGTTKFTSRSDRKYGNLLPSPVIDSEFALHFGGPVPPHVPNRATRRACTLVAPHAKCKPAAVQDHGPVSGEGAGSFV